MWSRPLHGHTQLWVACALLIGTPSHAARPLATDDAGVLEARDCEAEFYASRLQLPGLTRETTASVQATCGLGAHTQAALAYGRSTFEDAGAGGRRESMLLSAKTQILSSELLSLALSGGGVLGRAVGEPFQFDGVYATAVLSRQFGPDWRGHANVGWARSREGGVDSTTWNLAAEYTLREGLDLGAEYYGDDRSRPWIGIGLRLAASTSWVFGSSYAVQSDTLQQRLLTLGLTLSF